MGGLRIVSAAVGTAALVALAASCSGGASPSSASTARTARTGRTAPTSQAPSSASATSSASTAPVLRVRVGGKPCGVLVVGPQVWVTISAENTVRRVERASGTALAPVDVGSQPCGLASGAGSVWVENFGSNDLTRLDERTGRVQATVPVGASPYDVTYAAGAAWVTDNLDGTVSRVDARTQRRTVVRVGGNPVGIVYAAGGLWVGTGEEVVRIDARRAVVTDRLTAGAGAGWTAASGGDVWIMNGQDGTVTHIDAVHRRVLRTVAVGPSPLDGDVDAGVLWVPLKDGQVVQLDASTDAVTTTRSTGVGVPFVVDAQGGQVWTADFRGTDLVRLR